MVTGKNRKKKNKAVAFKRSFDLGYGTETDIRDRNGDLVISHDMATGKSMPVGDFFKIYMAGKQNLPLALNIKADGLAAKLGEYLKRYKITNYFVFDMSVPDIRAYPDAGLITYVRVSDVEPVPAFYERCDGIWFDAFSEWYKPRDIRKYLDDGKPVCLVSSDIHKRDHLPSWKMLRDGKMDQEENFTL